MSKEQYFNVDRWQGDFRAASQRVEVSVVTSTIILDLCTRGSLADHHRPLPRFCFHLNLLPLSVFVPCPAVLNLFLCLSVSCPSVLTLSPWLSSCDTWRCPTVHCCSHLSHLRMARYLFHLIPHFSFGVSDFWSFSILSPLVCNRGRNAKGDSDDRICSDDDCG